MEMTNFNLIDQYFYFVGTFIIILITLYKAYDVSKFRNNENIRYKSYINEINFQYEDKEPKDEQNKDLNKESTYEDIFGD